VIVRAAPVLPPEEAARRAGRGALPVWAASPGDADQGIEREVVATDPVRIVRGSSVEELEQAWREERGRWAAGPHPCVPIAFGYLSYDLARALERWKGRARPGTGWCDLEFRFFDAVWIRAGDGAAIWACNADAADRLRALLGAPSEAKLSAPSLSMGPLEACEPPSLHLEGVRRILTYLRAGDAYQVNLARRLRARLAPDDGPPGLALAARLAAQSPAPHAFWLADGDARTALVGNSPERFLRVHTDGKIETRPIKGTRPRTAGPQDRGAQAASDDDGRDDGAEELGRSSKDRAEHTMIVDLERSDLGRVCLPGSVAVQGFARLLSLPTVHHMVTTVSGRLRPDAGLTDIVRATFPGGSVTGAPKLRAMEIIDELEPARRGPYTGATGWLGAGGDLDLAVAIRTALVTGSDLLLWVGGGIVIDSVPEDELAETEAKARAFSRLCDSR